MKKTQENQIRPYWLDIYRYNGSKNANFQLCEPYGLQSCPVPEIGS